MNNFTWNTKIFFLKCFHFMQIILQSVLWIYFCLLTASPQFKSDRIFLCNKNVIQKELGKCQCMKCLFLICLGDDSQCVADDVLDLCEKLQICVTFYIAIYPIYASIISRDVCLGWGCIIPACFSLRATAGYSPAQCYYTPQEGTISSLVTAMWLKNIIFLWYALFIWIWESIVSKICL